MSNEIQTPEESEAVLIIALREFASSIESPPKNIKEKKSIHH